MVLSAVGAGAREAFLEDAQVLYLGDSELPPSERPTTTALAADLKRHERLGALQDAVIVRLSGPCSSALVAEFDDAPFANRSNKVVVDEQHGDEYRIALQPAVAAKDATSSVRRSTHVAMIGSS